MALLLAAANATGPSVRTFINALTAGANLSPSAATNATPAVITATAHGLSSGDFVAQWGFTTNTNCNGVFYVTVVDANSYKLSSTYANYLAGTFIAGNGATTAGNAVRLTSAAKPHDIENVARTLRSRSYVRDTDQTFSVGFPTASTADLRLESTVQTIFGQ